MRELDAHHAIHILHEQVEDEVLKMGKETEIDHVLVRRSPLKTIKDIKVPSGEDLAPQPRPLLADIAIDLPKKPKTRTHERNGASGGGSCTNSKGNTSKRRYWKPDFQIPKSRSSRSGATLQRPFCDVQRNRWGKLEVVSEGTGKHISRFRFINMREHMSFKNAIQT
ncbi:unnamed protein product [Haemonchus placei]|uniref:AP2/ERF domain-containing protein n=1 Tax=Haemonchus placei TaxID=6290 RepID=A0A0N4VRY3_HAEPC|nr:unnamed protein product [Haemonchus placei]